MGADDTKVATGARAIVSVLVVTATLITQTLAAFGDTKGERRPNIVLIMADDMGRETVGAYGGESYKTPHLDELARTGMRFDQAHSLPVCTPTRVQLMSGRYNSRNYVGFGVMDPDIYTIGNLMRDAGYATFMGGKWQLRGGREAPYKAGFDEYCLWQLTHFAGNNAPRYVNPGLDINGEYRRFTNGEYGPDIVTNHINDFIERKKDQPFFVYYAMILPHDPFEPTPDSTDWDPKARQNDEREAGPSTTGQDAPRYFPDMIAYTDKMVGKIVAKLDALDLREETLVIFIGDNGTSRRITSVMNGRTIRGGKLSSTHAGTHVPMIVNWPGTVPAGTTNEELICFTSFFPTFAELARHDVSALPLDGQSIVPLFKGEDGSARDWLYMWWSRNNTVNSPGDEFARTHRYKLYRNGRFHDLQVDPEEEQPIPRDRLTDDQQKVRTRLQAIIESYTRPNFFSERQ